MKAQEILTKDIGIICKKYSEFVELMEYFEKNEIRWVSGETAIGGMSRIWEDYRSKTIIYYKHKEISYGHLDNISKERCGIIIKCKDIRFGNYLEYNINIRIDLANETI